MKNSILGIKLDNYSYSELDLKLKRCIFEFKRCFIVTLNPEIVLKAQKDPLYKKIINKADIVLADGVGLIWAARILKLPTPFRITGMDLVRILSKISEQNNCSIFLLGGRGDTAFKASLKLKEKFPQIKIVGTDEGGEVDEKGDLKNNKEILEKINKLKPDILLVAFGAPKQEKWIYKNFSQIHSVKIAVGVGGVFDYLAGKVKSPPYWIKRIGLEWLFRLFTQPKRIKRIFKATFVFLFCVLKTKFYPK